MSPLATSITKYASDTAYAQWQKACSDTLNFVEKVATENGDRERLPSREVMEKCLESSLVWLGLRPLRYVIEFKKWLSVEDADAFLKEQTEGTHINAHKDMRQEAVVIFHNQDIQRLHLLPLRFEKSLNGHKNLIVAVRRGSTADSAAIEEMRTRANAYDVQVIIAIPEDYDACIASLSAVRSGDVQGDNTDFSEEDIISASGQDTQVTSVREVERRTKASQCWATLVSATTDEEADLRSSEDLAAAERVGNIIGSILRTAITNNASDIHFETTVDSNLQPLMNVRIRVDGILNHIHTTDEHTGRLIVNRFRVAGNLETGTTGSSSGRYEIAPPNVGRYDLRLEALPSMGGSMRMTIRLLSQKSSTQVLQDIYPARINSIAADLKKIMEDSSEGLILLSGQTGAGKSTTLQAMLRTIISDEINVMTAEDPIEYMVPQISQIQANPKQNFSFDKILVSMMRMDPDVIMIGEIRDMETAEMALKAAETGHLVISTVHALGAAAAPARITGLGVPPHVLAPLLKAVLSQRLLRRLCQACLKHGGNPRASCPSCAGAGYSGRVAVGELMKINNPIRELISSSAPHQKIETYATTQNNMQLMADHARLLLKHKEVSLPEVGRVLGGEIRDRIAAETPEASSMEIHAGQVIIENAQEDQQLSQSGGLLQPQISTQTPEQLAPSQLSKPQIKLMQ